MTSVANILVSAYSRQQRLPSSSRRHNQMVKMNDSSLTSRGCCSQGGPKQEQPEGSREEEKVANVHEIQKKD